MYSIIGSGNIYTDTIKMTKTPNYFLKWLYLFIFQPMCMSVSFSVKCETSGIKKVTWELRTIAWGSQQPTSHLHSLSLLRKTQSHRKATKRFCAHAHLTPCFKTATQTNIKLSYTLQRKQNEHFWARQAKPQGG